MKQFLRISNINLLVQQEIITSAAQSIYTQWLRQHGLCIRGLSVVFIGRSFEWNDRPLMKFEHAEVRMSMSAWWKWNSGNGEVGGVCTHKTGIVTSCIEKKIGTWSNDFKCVFAFVFFICVCVCVCYLGWHVWVPQFVLCNTCDKLFNCCSVKANHERHSSDVLQKLLCHTLRVLTWMVYNTAVLLLNACMLPKLSVFV